MDHDPLAEKLFEMKLIDIYRKSGSVHEKLSLADFRGLFPITYKNGKALSPDKPASDLDRTIFLEVLIAFKQSFS